MKWLFEPGAPDELVDEIYMHTLALAIFAAIQRAPTARVTVLKTMRSPPAS